MCFYISESETLLLARSPGLNFGVFEYHTPKNFFKWNIQNKTPDDIIKLSNVIRSFILNTPHKNFFGVWYSKTPQF